MIAALTAQMCSALQTKSSGSVPDNRLTWVVTGTGVLNCRLDIRPDGWSFRESDRRAYLKAVLPGCLAGSLCTAHKTRRETVKQPQMHRATARRMKLLLLLRPGDKLSAAEFEKTREIEFPPSPFLFVYLID